jgi:hypothetical protein
MTNKWSQSKDNWIGSNMKTKTYPISWMKQNKLLGKLRTCNKSMLSSTSSIGKPIMIWLISKLIWSPSWFGANDERLCQNGVVQFGTTGYHNQFGTYLSKTQGTTCSYPRRIWQGEAKSYYSNPRLEGSIWNNQGTTEKTSPHSTC